MKERRPSATAVQAGVQAGGDADGPASRDHKKRGLPLRTIAIALFSCGLITAIVFGAGPNRIAEVFADTGWLGIAHLMFLYTIGQFLRAMRFTVCIPQSRPSIGRMFGVVCMHQFLNHVLPARLGELSFPLLASRYASVPVSAATRLLIVIRIYELIILGLFFVGAASFLAFRLDAKFLVGSIAMCAVALLMLVLLLVLGIPKIIQVTASMLDRIPLDRWRRSALRMRTASYLASLDTEFSRPRQAREKVAVAVFSVLIWLLIFWISFEALRYAGIDVGLIDTVVGSSFANASHVLPINTFGSFGSLEAGWTFGFALLGVPAKSALATGFALHVIGIVFLAVTASFSWLALHWETRKHDAMSKKQ